ncbi:MAG TPA: hypothetical protein VM099_01985 [Gemmatimonadaceae bacterium]|nr:hypothetical protein [Gemmatimonadaceae bacterium]
MTLRSKIVIALLFPTVATACVTSRVTPFDPTPVMDHRTPADAIRFYETEMPRCQYKEIGHVTAKGNWLTGWGRVVHRVRERAHDLGGDAVIRVNERTRIDGAVISRGSISTTESNSLTGTVVRFVNPNCRE